MTVSRTFSFLNPFSRSFLAPQIQKGSNSKESNIRTLPFELLGKIFDLHNDQGFATLTSVNREWKSIGTRVWKNQYKKKVDHLQKVEEYFLHSITFLYPPPFEKNLPQNPQKLHDFCSAREYLLISSLSRLDINDLIHLESSLPQKPTLDKGAADLDVPNLNSQVLKLGSEILKKAQNTIQVNIHLRPRYHFANAGSKNKQITSGGFPYSRGDLLIEATARVDGNQWSKQDPRSLIMKKLKYLPSHAIETWKEGETHDITYQAYVVHYTCQQLFPWQSLSSFEGVSHLLITQAKEKSLPFAMRQGIRHFPHSLY